MKKIMILMLGILISAGSAFAMGVNGTGSATTEEKGGDDLMGDFNNLVKEVKEKDSCVCTMEYAPVCGKLENGKEKTFSNKCQAGCAKAKVLYRGSCDKKESSEKGIKKNITATKTISLKTPKNIKTKKIEAGFNTGITGGISGINNKVPKPKLEAGAELKTENNWMKVDEQFEFNPKTKEWRDKVGICHTCTPENGFTKDGKIMIDGKVEAEISGKNDDAIFGDPHITEKDSGRWKFSLKNGEDSDKLTIKVKEKVLKAAGAEKIIGKVEVKTEDDKKVALVKTEKKKKFLGLFDFNMEAEVKINVETGEVIEVDEPWYSFLLF